MDYITIIATRSLILFMDPPASPKPKPFKVSRHSSPTYRHPYTTPSNSERNINPASPTSTNTTPTLPKLTIPNHTPNHNFNDEPIIMPLNSLMIMDTDCAHYLVHHHLLNRVHRASKAQLADAEVMAWQEVDKAKMFARGLGEWFGKNLAGRNGIEECELEDIAEKFGVGIVPPPRRVMGEDVTVGGKGDHGAIEHPEMQNDDDERWLERVVKERGTVKNRYGDDEEEEVGEIHSPASSGGATLSDTELVVS